MKTISLILLILILFISATSFSNPLIIAQPLEEIDYYVLLIDGEEYLTSPSIDLTFFYDISELNDGEYLLEIISVIEDSKSNPVPFYLIKETNDEWITYQIQKDPFQHEIDPFYDYRFYEPLELKIKNTPKDIGDEDKNGCFISTLL